ncbi:2-hydroxyacid dehydrogenase [Rhabdochlamydiaceae symbiont of Dictyostelium giganteum]|uniref:2-hydroxyacid dehydrogenase n=1 Tax=Rhabdochlamydiaceae symbiont of Dictyostelium giganteum TaxID=3342349 RepID=UPI00384B1A32
MKRIYITRPLMPIAHEMLSHYFHVEQNREDRALLKSELIQVMQTFDGVLSTLIDPFDEEVLSYAETLKVISNCASGLDNIDQEMALKKGIKVFNVPHATTDSTADLTLAILLALIRKVPKARDYVKEGLWKGWDPSLFLGEELKGKTWGILGYGDIGKAVAKRALGFGLKVIAHSRKGFISSHENILSVSLEELYQTSDYLSLHVPLTEETSGMIHQGAFLQMKKRPVLINMARGKVVVTKDLLEALSRGWIRAAALDVTDPEPIDSTHLLCHHDNVLILPHIGSATTECRSQMARQAAENLVSYFYD